MFLNIDLGKVTHSALRLRSTQTALYPVNIVAYCVLLCTKAFICSRMSHRAAKRVMQVALSAVAYQRQSKALSVRFSAMLRHTSIKYP